VVLAALAALWRYTPIGEWLTVARVTAWSRAVRQTTWAPVALILAYTPAAFLLFPRPLLTLFAVVTFGPWFGFAYSAAGILAAALATYYAGRVIRHDTVIRLAGKRADKAGKMLRRHGVLSIFASNMVPVPPFAVQGMIAGAVRIPLRDYTLGSVLGMLPGLLAATVFGHQIVRALEDPAGMSYWIIGAVIVSFAAFSYFVGRWASKQ
jgi:phospholipase D1/2